MALILVAFHPTRKTQRPLLYEDFLELNRQGKNLSVSKMIGMIDDLRASGRDCRFIKHLGDIVYELKTRTSQGGARVYFYRLSKDRYVLVRAEVKKENQATESLLLDVLDVAEAVEKKQKLLVPPLKGEE